MQRVDRGAEGVGHGLIGVGVDDEDFDGDGGRCLGHCLWEGGGGEGRLEDMVAITLVGLVVWG